MRYINSGLLTALFLMVTLGLTILGLVTIYSTTYAIDSNKYLMMQTIWVILGVISSAVVMFLNSGFLARMSKWILLATFLVLAYLALANGIHQLTGWQMPLVTIRGGACRWLNIGSRVTLQPSEFVKFALVLFLASYYGRLSGQQISDFKRGFVIPGLISALVLVMILLGRSLSVTILGTFAVGVTMYLAGVRMRYLLTAFLLAVTLGALSVMATPYRRQRILNHFFKNDATATVKVDNYQLDSAICAMGSGGMFGRGLGQGRLKHKDIPEARTDFIFAVIGEEFGFLGMCSGILGYLLFGIFSILLGYRAQTRQGMLLCYVIGIIIPAQAIVNFSVVSGFGPTTGVTAPLVSYGGSSVLSVALCVGLVLNVCRNNYLAEQNNI